MKKIKVGQIGIGHNHAEAKMKAVRKFPELFEVVGYAEENEAWVEKRGNKEGYSGLPRLSVECSAVLTASVQARKAYPGLPIVFSGGVASNSMLRKELAALDPVFSEPQYSTDNAMGVAVLTHRLKG